MSHDIDQKKFKDEFSAKDYLQNYYSEADLNMVNRYVVEKTAAAETMRIMMWLDIACRPLIKAFFGKEKATLLELGGGPTLYQLMNIVSDVKEIYFTDYVEDNLNEIRAWKSKDQAAYNWGTFLKAALMIKNDTAQVSGEDIESLENEIRNKLTKVETCDIFKKDLGIIEGSFNIISTHFVAESATSSRKEWEEALKNIYNKLSDKGLLFMSALRGAKSSYKVLDKNFPAVELYESDVEEGLRNAGFDVVSISSIHTDDTINNYEGFMFIIAQKK